MSNVQDFGAAGDGKSDDTEAIQHAIDDGDGVLELPRGDYRITKTLVVDLAKNGRRAIHGAGGTAKLVMDGPGPAIFLKGTHASSADPNGFRPEVWQNERMPTVSGLEIEGRHAEADGIRIEGVMQATLTGVLIRRVRTAIHLTKRNRNLLVDHCHLYHNTGIGIHFDGVNLHQACVTGSHVSYNRLGGIRIDGGEIRNFQITGCDIEYNNNRAHGVPDADAEPTAEVYIDVREGSVREGTISGCTIQATDSPNGANIRLIGQGADVNHKMGMWAISGNLIGSQRTNVWLTAVRGVVLTGNYVYSGHHRNLLVEQSRNVVVGSNCFGHNPDYRTNELCTGVRFVDCVDVVLNGTLIQDCQAGTHTVPGAPPIERQGLLELIRVRRANLTGVQVVDSAPNGVYLEDCTDTVLNGCTILDGRETPLMERAIAWKGDARGSLVSACRLGNGTQGASLVPESVKLANNLTDGPPPPQQR